MYRKNNPWLSLVALLLLALILVLTGTGCTVKAEAAQTKRYTYEVEDHYGGLKFYTITDTETGNQYLYVKTSRADAGGGLTKLED